MSAPTYWDSRRNHAVVTEENQAAASPRKNMGLMVPAKEQRNSLGFLFIGLLAAITEREALAEGEPPSKPMAKGSRGGIFVERVMACVSV